MVFRAIGLRLSIVGALLIIASCVGTPAAFAAAEDLTDRYQGMFLAETLDGVQYYWYLHPSEKTRYAVSDSVDFSRLLRKAGEGATRSQFSAIPEAGATSIMTSNATQAAYGMRGRIFTAIDDNGRAWYVNPLDLHRYYLANGEVGFEVVKSLAIDIRSDRLSAIPITKTLGFDTMSYAGAQENEEALAIKNDLYGAVLDTLTSDHYYKEKFSASDLVYGSLKGMAQATGDPNTEFYPPVEQEDQQQTFYGETSIEGIGAVIDRRNESFYIISLIKGAPAERAGIYRGDSIVAINDESTANLSVDQAVSRIKGPAGTTVKLTVFRPSTDRLIDFIVTREKFIVTWVNDDTFEDGSIAYISIGLFTADLVENFQKSLNKVVSPKTKGLIIDLRNNNGGLTQTSLQLADYWLLDGQEIMIEKRRDGSIQYVASAGRIIPDVPTVILMNEETASASEIFIAALKHQNLVTTVGTKTFGKGTGQNLITFENGAGLKFTTFEWLAPAGVSVEGKGITPDIIVEEASSGDVQLNRALDLIHFGR